MDYWLVIAPISGVISILLALYLFAYLGRQESGPPKTQEIGSAIREGSFAYLKREYKTLVPFSLVLAIALAAFISPTLALTYLLGSACSGLAGYLGMSAALKANIRAASAARKGLGLAFPIAFYGGAVMGLAVVGLAVTTMSLLYYIFRDAEIMLGFSFGASSMALFAKAGGGIYTKTADIGADLVGKVELGIPEDDPRNPAVIADNVGDNVGDVAGMGADLFDSYVASIVAAMIIGAETLRGVHIILPLVVAAAGILASVVGTLFVRVREGGSPGAALNRGTFSTCAIFALLTYVVVVGLGVNLSIFYATIAGLVAGIVIGITTDYFTSIDRGPVLRTAEASRTGAAITILSGFSYGLLSAVPAILGICAAMVVAWHFAQVYGVAIAAVGMLATVGMVVSNDAFGPIADNARGIAQMSGLGEEVVEVADKLDAAGNTVKAITKGFAIGAAALTVLALFGAYAETVNIRSIDLMNPFVLAGTFIGALMPAIFSALTILGVEKNAYRMVEEVRRQFREIAGLLQGEARPDYTTCVDIATKGALQELILPSVLAIVVPLAVGFILGTEALGGFLGGSIISGIIFALLMANSGGAWDNAKKYIEAGAFGGKGSEAHKAAVVGDTVGDPFKDTAGPSINTLLVVMSLTATIFAPLILKLALR